MNSYLICVLPLVKIEYLKISSFDFLILKKNVITKSPNILCVVEFNKMKFIIFVIKLFLWKLKKYRQFLSLFLDTKPF